MPTAKAFPLSALLSVVTGRLLALGELVDLEAHLAGRPVQLAELATTARALRPRLLALFPELAEAQTHLPDLDRRLAAAGRRAPVVAAWLADVARSCALPPSYRVPAGGEPPNTP